ncbi:hypothetical protein GGQ68_002228 [Sagittula marina]|uniref:Uncharacterized protein n=1 Tax=Sagittula marina TaxID=943940 RepID=A0A7W6DSI4_9RHOB|nr:hypothetical protein [Sagittula marina]
MALPNVTNIRQFGNGLFSFMFAFDAHPHKPPQNAGLDVRFSSLGQKLARSIDCHPSPAV